LLHSSDTLILTLHSKTLSKLIALPVVLCDRKMQSLALSGHKFQAQKDLGRRDTESFEGNRNRMERSKSYSSGPWQMESSL